MHGIKGKVPRLLLTLDNKIEKFKEGNKWQGSGGVK